jgi:hypothetical protein
MESKNSDFGRRKNPRDAIFWAQNGVKMTQNHTKMWIFWRSSNFSRNFGRRWLGFFLQFKKVKKMKNRGSVKSTPFLIPFGPFS